MRLQIYTDESDGGERLIRAMKQEGVTVVREETEDAEIGRASCRERV